MIYFVIFAEDTVLLLSGGAYRASIPSMMIMMPTVFFIGLSNITGIQVLTPQNEEKRVLYSILWGAGVDLILNLVLIPKYASFGAAFATVIAELVVLIVQCIYLKGMFKFILKEVDFFKIAAAVLLACLAGILV